MRVPKKDLQKSPKINPNKVYTYINYKLPDSTPPLPKDEINPNQPLTPTKWRKFYSGYKAKIPKLKIDLCSNTHQSVMHCQ